MRKLFLLVLLAYSFTAFAGDDPRMDMQPKYVPFKYWKPYAGVRRYIIPEVWGGTYYKIGYNFTCNPGDTLIFADSIKSNTCELEDFAGTALLPIVIMGGGRPDSVQWCPAFKFNSCSYIKLTGEGKTNFWGAQNSGAFSAVDILGKSHDILVTRISIYNVGYAVRAKQDQVCDTLFNYPYNNINHIEISYLKIFRVSQDAIYGGNTDPYGTRPINCGGVTKYYIPAHISFFNTHHCTIDSVGRTAIQYSNADQGTNIIRANIISRTGYELNNTQGAGIIVNGFSSVGAVIDSNIVRRTFQQCANIGVIGTSLIQYNNFDSAGMLPLAQYDKLILTNTDTSYQKISAGGTLNDVWFVVNITKISGTNNGTVQLFYSQNDTTYTAFGSPTAMDNSSVQQIKINMNVSSKYWKIVTKQTSTGVCKSEAIVWNPGYPFSMDLGCGIFVPTEPSTSTVIVWHNKFGNLDDYNFGNNNGKNVRFNNNGYWTSNNVFCDNTKQNGDTATVTTNGVYYSTNCTPFNIPPFVLTGNNDTLTLPTNSTSVFANAGDVDGTIVTYAWTKQSGPSTYTITSASSARTTITGLVQGTYVFRCTVTDNLGASAYNQITILAQVPPNTAPDVNAGADQLIFPPTSSVTLTGTVTSPVGSPIVSYLWQKVSGGSATITSPSTISTTVTGLSAGVYYFSLTATDTSNYSSTDTMSVVVASSPPAYRYYRTITIDKTKIVGSNTDFPILIDTILTSLKTVANGGNVQNSNGYDIIFTSDIVGDSLLKWEVEQYNASTGRITAWAKTDINSTNNKTIYIHYGNANISTFQGNIAATWSNSYSGVYHLGTGSVLSTTNSLGSNNATNNSITATTGVIYGAGTWASGNNLSIASLFSNPASVTLSAWVNLTTNGSIASEVISMGDHVSLRVDQTTFGTGVSGFYYTGASWPQINGGSPILNTGWHYVAYTVTNGDQKIYLDGAQVGSGSNAADISWTGLASATKIGIHGNGATNVNFGGKIDEPRITAAIRSLGWITTEYNNQSSPKTFYSVGSEVDLGVPVYPIFQIKRRVIVR